MVIGRFIISDRRWFPLPGTRGRFKHLATVLMGTREFIAFIDNQGNTSYVEEITGGHLEQIKEESLWEELINFLQEQQILSYTSQI